MSEEHDDNVAEIRPGAACCEEIHPDSNQRCLLPPEHGHLPHCTRRLPDVIYTVEIPVGTRPEDRRFVHWRSVEEDRDRLDPDQRGPGVPWTGERVRDSDSNMRNPFVPGAGGVLREDADEPK